MSSFEVMAFNFSGAVNIDNSPHNSSNLPTDNNTSTEHDKEMEETKTVVLDGIVSLTSPPAGPSGTSNSSDDPLNKNKEKS